MPDLSQADAVNNVTAVEPAARRRRRRTLSFLRRHPMAAGFGILLLTTIGMRISWGWQVQQKLQAQRAALLASGARLDAADLAFAAPPDERNARKLIDQASAADTGWAPANGSATYPEYPPFGAAWERAASTSETSNATVFRLVRQVRLMKNPEFRTPWAQPIFNTRLPSLGGSRQIANTVADGALYSHVQGQDTQAIERLLDVLQLAKLVTQDNFAVSHLVGIGITAMATNRTDIIAPGLRLDDPEVRRLTRQLIAVLLDDEEDIEAFRQSFVFERLFAQDALGAMTAGSAVVNVLADQQLVRVNEQFLAYSRATRETNAKSASAIYAALPALRTAAPGKPGKYDPPDYAGAYDDWQMVHPRYFVQMFRILGERRAAAVSLAVQLYRHDHDGQFPPALEDLVPDYLPAVPVDPFHADGRPLGYTLLKAGRPDGGDRPMVFFDAGPNVPGVIDPEPMYGWHPIPRSDGTRQYRDLSRWSPAVRRVDQIMKEEEEAERLEKEELERLEKELGENTEPEIPSE